MNYLSNTTPILVEERTRKHRAQIASRLYNMDFNLVPMNGKDPCCKWKHLQDRRVKPEEVKGWMTGRFPSKVGRRSWKAKNLNFALVTGAMPWSETNPGIIVVDSDDEEAEELVLNCCEPTPMVQITGSGNKQFVYRRPSVGNVAHIGNPTKLKIDGKQYNLDIRGDGGLIMCPGSIHPRTNRVYKSFVSVPADIDSADHDSVISEVELSIDEREEQARLYLAKVPGTQEGNGADKNCAALTMKLLYGFALPVDIVQELLNEWGEKPDQLYADGTWYPWTEVDISRKIEWCLGQEYRGEVGDKLNPARDLGDMEARIDEIVESFETSIPPTIDPKNHLEVAELFFAECFTSEYGRELICHHGRWHRWSGTLYEVITDDDIKAKLWHWLRKCRMWHKDERVPLKPSRSLVVGVLDALKAVAHAVSALEQPCWLARGPEEVIAFQNGLLDVGKFLESENTELLRHTPEWFSANCLPHRFNPSAGCPLWLDFLDQAFDKDKERITALQQWFGYNLINDNRQQKAAMLIGPPRSGKGTTIAVMSALLGKHNVASLSLDDLGGQFGLHPLIGKLAAIIDEAQLGKFSKTSQVLRRLKAISGGADQTVDRKNVDALTGVPLKVRFTLTMNELPRLPDASAAMVSRWLCIPYFNSHVGKEDIGLLDRLLKEVSGITNWALEGLRQLRRNGRFKNPTCGEEILRDFAEQSSPVMAFVGECCCVGPDESVERAQLQSAWKDWCEENGHVAGSVNEFGRKLRSVIPKIRNERPNIGGDRKRCYVGVGLTHEHREHLRLKNMVS
jgi:P4 family phage/plasmid primase-like protien